MLEGERLLKLHGLKDLGWKFDIGNRKRQIGTCFHSTKTITISKWWIEDSTPEAITDTILHEIAHALVGPGNGHNKVWRAMCIKVGAKPIRCGDVVEHKTTAKPNYIVVCPTCLTQWPRTRLKKTTANAQHCGVPVVVYRVKPQ